MKRWLTRISICMALGAVTTVAVAWGCSIKYPGSPNLGWVSDVRGWPQPSMERSFSYYHVFTATKRGFVVLHPPCDHSCQFVQAVRTVIAEILDGLAGLPLMQADGYRPVFERGR